VVGGATRRAVRAEQSLAADRGEERTVYFDISRLYGRF
jgi:hypothetical protein